MVDCGATGVTIRSDYSEDEHPAAPVIEGTLHDPLMRNNLSLKAKVDTGFSGSLLITAEQYMELGLQAFEETQKSIAGRGATGVVVPLAASKGVLQLGSVRVNCFVYSTPLLLKPLLGREVLNRWRAVLDGPKKELEIEL